MLPLVFLVRNVNGDNPALAAYLALWVIPMNGVPRRASVMRPSKAAEIEGIEDRSRGRTVKRKGEKVQRTNFQ
jgi:hypothetical protein